MGSPKYFIVWEDNEDGFHFEEYETSNLLKVEERVLTLVTSGKTPIVIRGEKLNWKNVEVVKSIKLIR